MTFTILILFIKGSVRFLVTDRCFFPPLKGIQELAFQSLVFLSLKALLVFLPFRDKYALFPVTASVQLSIKDRFSVIERYACFPVI